MNLSVDLFGTTFQNPVLLAAGTCGFGRELAEVLDLEALGGFVTKSVTLEPRHGNLPPRVAEFGAGMLNSVGLANPGVAAVLRDELPWIRAHVRKPRVFVSVAGRRESEFPRLIEELDGAGGFLGFEVNLSCPNDRTRTALPFALDRDSAGRIVEACRARTGRPLLAKLAPNDPDIVRTARVARDAGADGLTLVNTLPGLALDPARGGALLGAGEGGVSGPALRPAGVRAVRHARAAVALPLVGVGGVLTAEDVVQYARAGASLVGVGTASFADPRAALKILRGLHRFGRRHGVSRFLDLVPPSGVEDGRADGEAPADSDGGDSAWQA